jgi:hypothetical protein
VGNFWLNQLQIETIRQITGWKVGATFFARADNGIVVYKFIDLVPAINQTTDDLTPMGAVFNIGSKATGVAKSFVPGLSAVPF